LRNEIEKIVNSDEGLTYDTLMNMKYLNMVVSETLRKYPVIPMSMRKCTETYRIPNTLLDIPKGTTVIVPSLSFHHDPSYYPNPMTFDPQRFTDESIKSRPAFTYLPFGESIGC
jgi:cytochrome P450 family 6